MLFVITPKNVYATRRLQEEAKKQSVHLIAMDVNDLAARRFVVDVKKYEVLYVRQAYPYHTAVIELARRFAHSGKRVVDDAVLYRDIGRGKGEMYQGLTRGGVLIPETKPLQNTTPPRLLSGSTPSFSGGERDPSLLLNKEEYPEGGRWLYPYIIKWIFGFGSQHVYLIKNNDDLAQVLQRYPAEQLLIQEFIRAKYEYKVITIGYKSVPVILRFKTYGSAFRADLSDFEVLRHPESNEELAMTRVIELAESSARTLGRELAKVDILEDETGNLLVLEVNRWPGLQNFEKSTEYNAAGEFIKYLVRA